VFGLRPLHGFVPPQFGQGSMLRIALLPAQTVVNSRNVKRNKNQNIVKNDLTNNVLLVNII
jgi:hypothetical protein